MNLRRAGRDAARAFTMLFGALLALPALPASTQVLPQALAPSAPFPPVRSSSVDREAVAPGIVRATYRLLTAAGPVVVSVVTVDVHDPSVRLGTVLAHDTIVSKDETTSSMARRTGAVAGVNGDYFDINASGAPVGVVVRDGALERTPSARAALTVARDGTIGFTTLRFAGTASSGASTWPIGAVNEWPPGGGVALLTPSFGTIPATPAGVTVLDLQPLGASRAPATRYRVAAVTSGPPWPATRAMRLAFGAAALAAAATPDVGDVVDLAYDTDPPLAGIAAAVGGGPMLLANGRP
ncbi:MAG TPA: hypothetical protein VHT53_11615, partial [Candidatus Elarobacter sp.]|nr:hypothetical protein [Candidatus Elarobacter sp.]